MTTENAADRASRVKSYQGKGISVTFDGTRCLHAAECVRGLPEVFDTSRRPWIQPGEADAEQVAEVVRRCPSGALHYVLDEGPTEDPLIPTLITVIPGGPLWVRGDFTIRTESGEHREVRAALCRCGSSAAAPYCDGSGDCVLWRDRG